MSQLLPCPQCSRHHRVCEPVCPFCGGALPACSGATAMNTHDRMSRAMLFASGAVLLGAAACAPVAVYGAPAPPFVPSQDAGSDAAGGGGVKPTDAGVHDDGKTATEATEAIDGGGDRV
jgi:hypothetical protein